MDNILSIKDLSVHYGKFAALSNVSANIPKGKIIGLLGPNGSGKTSLIKTVMGLVNNFTGIVEIAGLPPGAKANAHVSYLPDRNHIPLWFTPKQAISFFADFYEDFDSERAVEMLTRMGLPLDKALNTFSLGMQEKVQLALVMSRRAALYVLDEPLGAVDPASREFIINTILKNYPDGGSILLSTHIITDIEPILDRAIFLKKGELVMDDEVDTLREQHGMSLDGLFREVFKHAY